MSESEMLAKMNYMLENCDDAEVDFECIRNLYNLYLKTKNENAKYFAKLTLKDYRNLIKRINKEWEDKIRAKIEEVKDGTFDAKIILEQLLNEEE